MFLTIENNLGDMVTTNEEIKFKNSKREGLCKTYYSDNWYEENYKNNKLEGLWRRYDKSGALDEERNYKNGEWEGLRKWYYESGAL